MIVLQVLQLLLQRGAAVNAQDLDGQTPLHYAALNDQQEVCLYAGISSCTLLLLVMSRFLLHAVAMLLRPAHTYMLAHRLLQNMRSVCFPASSAYSD